MGWLDDLINYAPEPYDTSSYQGGLGGLEYLPKLLPNPELIQQGGLKLSRLLTPYQYETAPQLRDLGGALDIYHGLMSPLGVPKQAIDLAAGSLMDLGPAQFEAKLPGNEAGQLFWDALKNTSGPASLRASAGLVGAEPFISALGRGIGGMATDPSMYLLPSEAGIAFLPGMAEQVYGGLKAGGPEGYAEATLGALGLGAIGAGHLPAEGIKLPKVEDVTAKLPLQYEPATVGMGLGGLGEGKVKPELVRSEGNTLITGKNVPEPTDFRIFNERLGLPEGYIREPTSKDLDLSVLNVEGIKPPEKELPFLKIKEPSIPAEIKVEPEPVKVAPKEELNTIVQDLKTKYGEKAWRKEMTAKEKSLFETAQLKAVEAPVEKAAPISEPPKGPTNILPPTIEPPIPPKPEGPVPKELEPLSRFERAAYSLERNIAKASPEIGKAEKAYRQEHEVQASRAIGDITEATQGIDKSSENRIIRYMDGEPIVLRPKELTVVNKLRTTLDRIAKAAGDEGVLVGYRKNYFTHIAENLGQRKAETYYGKERLGNKPYGPLEKSRIKENINIVRSFDVLKQYADKATRRIAEAKFLDKDLSKVQAVGDIETKNYVENYIKQITARAKPAGPVSRALTSLRHVAALGDLTLTSVLQLGQGVHTTAYVGLRRAASAAIETLRNYRKADLEALKSGALYPSISHEVGIALGNKGYMHGVPTVDRAMRVHAFIAGRMLLEDARNGEPYARRLVAELGIKDLNDPNSLALAGKFVADKTQLRSDPAHLPAWFKTDAGKMATQYLNFAYANTKFMADMFRHPWQNAGQITRFAILGALAGEGISSFKEAIKSLIPGKGDDQDALKRMVDAWEGKDDFDSKTFFEKLQAITRNKRIPLDSPGWRFIQNLAGIGAGSIFQTLVEKVSSGQYRALPLGPAGGLAADIGESVYKSATEKSLKPLGRTALSNLPIPFVSGRRLSQYLLPKEKKGFKISPKMSYPKVKI